MAGKFDPHKNNKVFIDLAQSPAMRQMMKAVEGLRPLITSVQAVMPVMQDAERAKRLHELARAAKTKPLSCAIKAIQSEIEGYPLTARQILFLIMESGGLDVAASIKEMAKKGEAFTHAGGRQKDAVAKETRYIELLAKEDCASSAKMLYSKADKKKLNGMSLPAFSAHLTAARKKYPKRKKSTK